MAFRGRKGERTASAGRRWLKWYEVQTAKGHMVAEADS